MKATHQNLLAIGALLLMLAGTATAQYGYGEASEVLTASDGRIRGARNRTGKDFVLGGLFPIHSDDEDSGGGRCGEIRLERGLERMEAMLHALDRINEDPELLPDLQLGYDIRDTCNSENIGLDESIDLIITGSNLDIESCQSAVGTTTNGNGTEENETDVSLPTSGIVGAAASRVSVPIASLVRLFRTPQVSYASSSAILSNRDRYEYFYRTIPPDNLQAKAMIDLLRHFSWSYVSTVYSRNPYGEPGIDEFHALAGESGICIDLNKGIDDDFSEEEFDELRDLLIESTANIVVLFTSQDNAERLLSRIANSTARHRFTWIASDAWARSISTVHQFNETAAGLFGFAPLTFHEEEFHNYFSNLTIESNKRNPWFPEFYAAFVSCTLNGSLNDTCDEDRNVTRLPRYEQGNFIPLVIDAVYTFAYALQDYLDDNCDKPLQWFRANQSCRGQKEELNGEELLRYISKVNFVNPLTTNRVLFDDEGNVEGKYEIVNYQAMPTGNGLSYFFQSVGVWDSSIAAGNLSNSSEEQALQLNAGMTLQFGLGADNDIIYNPQTSVCGRCSAGEYRRQVQSSCCGTCDPCIGQNYSVDPLATSCLVCREGYWGNNPLEGSDDCVEIEEHFLDFKHPLSIIIVIFACFGLIVVGGVCVVFGIYWRTPVIKSSGREQMVLLLIGIGASFVLVFFFVSPPSVGICTIQRVGLWLCFALIFGALLVKIIRVARIFLRGATNTRPRFMEPIYQVIFTLLIVLGQFLIVVCSLAYRNPDIDKDTRLDDDNSDDSPTNIITCVSDLDAVPFLILSVLYETFLLVVLTILGALSFKYPENFNEAKYIAFCSFSLGVVWIAFIPTTYCFAESEQELQNVATSLAVLMSGFAVLLLLFGPKLYIIIFQPHRNTKSFSTHHAKELQSQDFPLALGGAHLNIPLTSSTGFNNEETLGECCCCLFVCLLCLFNCLLCSLGW